MPDLAGLVLDIQDFSMRYPNSDGWILNGLTMNIESGERFALVGSSGCGKSTVAKSVLQLLPYGSTCKGKLVVTGQDPRELDQAKLRTLRGEAVGLIFQDPMTRLNPLMTVGGHLLDIFKAHRPHQDLSWAQARAKELLDQVGISHVRFNAYPHELSGGMRQRLAIALALALKPPLIIADEPTTNLDVVIANQIMSELSNLCNQSGTALLLITHDLALALRWCESMAILDQGHIVEKSQSQELLMSPQSFIGKRLVSAARERERNRVSLLLQDELVLEVNRLRCWHLCGGVPWNKKWIKAVDEVSFELHSGETLGVVGSSGCGKSTLCRALMGLVPIRGGEVKIKGKNIFKLQGQSLRKTRKLMQMVFQDPFASLNPKMTVGQAIADPLLIHNLSSSGKAREQTRSLLQAVGLNPPEEFENRLPHQLSGGQQQRVAIARALALNPKVLICDESVSMLDAEIQSEVLALLSSLQKQLGLAMIFVTHDLSVARGFCHRLIVLDQGRIVEEGSGQKLFDSPQAEITRKLLDVSPRLINQN